MAPQTCGHNAQAQAEPPHPAGATVAPAALRFFGCFGLGFVLGGSAVFKEGALPGVAKVADHAVGAAGDTHARIPLRIVAKVTRLVLVRTGLAFRRSKGERDQEQEHDRELIQSVPDGYHRIGIRLGRASARLSRGPRPGYIPGMWILYTLACAHLEALPPACNDAALSTCREPVQGADYFSEQGNRYFDTLDASADPDSKPNYSLDVARWEWPPWLLLTGYGRDLTLAVDELVLAAFPDTTVPIRDCRGFDVAPFGRCHVVMKIDGKDCPIYEEFTFNPQGEVTFVEAWSDLPGYFPSTEDDPWAENAEVDRLSTRIPGLGNDRGQIDLDSAAMVAAAQSDADVAEFVRHAKDFWGTWNETYAAAGDDLYARGCGWQ
jgi:hypothetical protein